MVTIELKAPKVYENYIKDNSEFDGIINEVFQDYIEKKQDEKIRDKLKNNSVFEKLNNSLEMKLGN